MAKLVPAWAAEFVDIEQQLLFDVILAANYLDIESLFDVTCCKVASMMRNKTAKEIRDTFNIENDYTPEEEAKFIEETTWCQNE